MNFNEVPPRLDLQSFFCEQLTLSLSGSTASASGIITIGSRDFWVIEPHIWVIDSNGNPLNENPTTVQDSILVNMYDNNDRKFNPDPINIFTLNRLKDNPLWKGWTIPRTTELTFEVTLPGFPAASVSTYPIRIDINLLGYKLM